MERKTFNIGAHQYLAEFFGEDDEKNSLYSSEFIMIRNFTLINNITCDNDIYIIEKKYFLEYCKELYNNETSEAIIFPISGKNIKSYSNSYLKFSNIFNGIDIPDLYDIDENTGDIIPGRNVYELYEINNGNLTKKKIKCNKIKIYHPLTKKHLNAIIDVNNYINNIHFHYLCKDISNYVSNSEIEIKYNNNTYSEYIEIYYPSINELFKIDENNNYVTFYKEDLNIIASSRNENFINSIISNDLLENIEEINGEQIVPLNFLIQPYRIVEETKNNESLFVKLYIKQLASIENNSLTYPINVTIYPYNYLDDKLKLYILDDNYNSIAFYYNIPYKFKLTNRIGFSDGIISSVSLFDYPNKSYFYSLYKDDPTTSPIKEAYKYYNNVSDDNYKMFANANIEKLFEDIDKVDSIDSNTIEIVKTVANTNAEDKIKLLEIWKDLMKKNILEEYEEEYKTTTYFLGYRIEIATDMNFKNIIYERNERTNFNDIDNFSFKLNDIFHDWGERPEKIIVRTYFIDRHLGIELQSNISIITKEWFKYLINSKNVYRLFNLTNANKNKDTDDEMKKINLNENNINFINKIKCIVNKDVNKNNNKLTVQQHYEPKILYRPMFYKTKDLQNIRLLSNTIQNIGVNLGEYMTKVETFKMVIENREIVESGRNDIYVIFNINTNLFTNNYGTYKITNQDDEFISSGNWTKY